MRDDKLQVFKWNTIISTTEKKTENFTICIVSVVNKKKKHVPEKCNKMKTK